MPSEYDTIWRTVDKFPETDEPTKKKPSPSAGSSTTTTKGGEQEERIDVDSFVKLYRAIDDLFEEDDKVEGVVSEPKAKANGKTSPPKTSPIRAVSNDTDSDDDDDDADEDPVMEEELESIFQQLCDASGLLTKDTLRAWDEVDALFNDGLLGEDEFNRLWDETRKSPGTTDKLDEQGFLSFNMALDDLFDFEDDDEDDEDEVDPRESVIAKVDATAVTPSTPESFAPRMVAGDDLSPDVLFVALANEDGLVGRAELSRWSELQEMLRAGDLLQSELDAIFARATKSEKDLSKLEENGFSELFQAIDDLFDDDDDDGDLAPAGGSSSTEAASADADSIKEELYNAVNALKDDDLMPCGLDALESEHKEIRGIVDRLEKIPTNFVRARKGNINSEDLTGTWELLYSSSSSMKFNHGLTGLGGSVPNGKFSSLRQKLMLTKFMSDVEYTEHIAVKPVAASFDVTVTGSWEIRKSISLFTGDTTIILAVAPDRVSYGPTSTRADHWKSLGSMNYLDLSYLDDNLRIMRGNTSINTIFVLQRSAS
jgi:PAP_fibrillin